MHRFELVGLVLSVYSVLDFEVAEIQTLNFFEISVFIFFQLFSDLFYYFKAFPQFHIQKFVSRFLVQHFVWVLLFWDEFDVQSPQTLLHQKTAFQLFSAHFHIPKPQLLLKTP